MSKIPPPSGGASSKAAAPKTFEYRLRAADPGPEGFSTHHVLKFHPGDKEAVMQFGPEWLLRKEAPKTSPYEEKRKAMAAKKRGPATEPPPPDMSWKQPWLITHAEDPDFVNSFIARRETDKRTSLDVMVNVTLTQVKVHAPKELSGPGSRVAEYNKQLGEIYGQCHKLVCGPAADVFSKKVERKSRTIEAADNTHYDITIVLARISSASVAELDKLIKQEEQIEGQVCREYAQQLKEKDRKFDLNGKICRYKVVDDGKKGHCFFWVESNAGNELVARPIHGDWFGARKDAMRRGIQDYGREEKDFKESKKAAQQPAPILNNNFKRLMQKTEDARAKNEGREDGLKGNKPVVKKKQYEQGGEDALKQKWREESHTLDDDMDCQQCGDIDDDDYDNKMAAAGDDFALNVDNLMREMNEDAPEEVRAEMSDSEGEEDDEKDLDENGRKMSRIMSGKPSKEDDKVMDDDEDEDTPMANADEPKKKESAGSIKLKIKQPSDSSISPSPAKRPAAGDGGAGASKRAKTAPAAAAPAAPLKSPTEARVRAAIEADPLMCIRKLIESFSIKRLPKEEQDKFSAIVKTVCVRTKKGIEDGPYKGQFVITTKKAAPAGAAPAASAPS